MVFKILLPVRQRIKGYSIPNLLSEEIQTIVCGRRKGHVLKRVLMKKERNKNMRRACRKRSSEAEELYSSEAMVGISRKELRKEGIIILDATHIEIARALGVEEPREGEFVPVRVKPATMRSGRLAQIDGRWWEVATASDPVVEGPELK